MFFREDHFFRGVRAHIRGLSKHLQEMNARLALSPRSRMPAEHPRESASRELALVRSPRRMKCCLGPNSPKGERHLMESITSVFDWFLAPENRLIMWIALGFLGIIVLFLVLKFFARFSKLAYNKDFPIDTREANLLALGFQQITNAQNYWNDPTASLSSTSSLHKLRDMWGLNSANDVYENVERLFMQRRRRELWQQLLALRAQAAQANGGKKPSSRQWLVAIKESGGTGKGEELEFVRAVEYYEKAFGKKHFPAHEPVLSFDAYALGQAVAVCTWGVGLGLISREDSMRMIEEINRVARQEFDSWAAFGRSYALGRAMHWSEGRADEDHAKQCREAVVAMEIALDAKQRGPWGLLPWRLPAN